MNKRVMLNSFCAVVALFAFGLNTPVFAEGTMFSVDVNETVLELTVPVNAEINLSPSTSSAVFGTTNVTVSVATNSINGYRMLMSVPNTDLTHTVSSESKISTLSEARSEANFETNAWGYKIVGDNYNPVQLSNELTSWSADSPTNGTNHVMTLAAKIDATIPSGAYQNILTFQAVTNPNAPKDLIMFDGNGADSGSMANQYIYQGEPTKLNANTFEKSGYTFNGWNTQIDGFGLGYGNEDEYYAANTGVAATTTLYAQWKLDSGSSGGGGGTAGKTLARAYEEAYLYNGGNYEGHRGMYVPVKDNQGNYTGDYFEADDPSDYAGIPARDLRFAMQDIDLLVGDEKVCDRATVVGSEAHVIDLRDNKSYWVTKLADGKCWMTQNLDYDIPAVVTSDLTDLNVYGEEGYTSSEGYSMNGDQIVFTPQTTTIPRSSIPASGSVSWSNAAYGLSLDPGNWFSDGTMSSVHRKNCNFLTQDFNCGDYYREGTPFESTGWHGHVGNYYTYPAAIATNNVAPFLNSHNTADAAPENSICPKGWRLPIGNIATNDYNDLIEAVDGYTILHRDRLYSGPMYFLEFGLYRGAQFITGTYGAYMSNSYSSSDTIGYGFEIGISNNVIRIELVNYSAYGYSPGKSVRCLAR